MPNEFLPKRIEVMDDDLADVLRQKSPAEKIATNAANDRTVRLLAEAGTQYLHPDWDDKQVHAEVLRPVCSGTS